MTTTPHRPAYGLVLRPDSTIDPIYEPTDYRTAWAHLGTEAADIVTCPDRGHVMSVDDLGLTKQLTVNWLAWQAYLRSPIYGVAVLFADDGRPLPEGLVTMLAVAAARLQAVGRLATAEQAGLIAADVAVPYWQPRRH